MAYGFCQKCYKQKARTKTTREQTVTVGGAVSKYGRHPAGVNWERGKASRRVVVQTQVKLSCGHYLVESQRSA